MQFETSSTNCPSCSKPLVWVGRSKRSHQGRDVYDLDFHCDSCNREFRFKDGKLQQLSNERDPVAENLAMRKAEVDSVRTRRCPGCGGPLDSWLTCERCHERYSAEKGELVSKMEELLKQRKPLSEFYALN